MTSLDFQGFCQAFLESDFSFSIAARVLFHESVPELRDLLLIPAKVFLAANELLSLGQRRYVR